MLRRAQGSGFKPLSSSLLVFLDSLGGLMVGPENGGWEKLSVLGPLKTPLF